MEYTLIRSSRRTIAVQITADGRVIVRAPKTVSQAKIESFLLEKSAWISKHLFAIDSAEKLPKYTNVQLSDLKSSAKSVVFERVKFYSEIIGVSYGKISVRCQRTRWGSCTASGNLNFNCLLVLLPSEISDYVVIHELCHRKQMNHSPAFWRLVEKYCPDYKARRIWLKKHGTEYLNRL